VALNKAHTSIWVKVLIVVLIVAFVSLFMYQGLAGLFSLFQQGGSQASSTTVDYVAAVNEQNQSITTALKATLASAPTSYTAAVAVADAYFNWAQQLTQPQAGASQPTTDAMAAAAQEWTQAKVAYDAATKLTKTFDAPMLTDRSFATLYATNDATQAIALVKVVTDKAPTFPQGWFHLGYYYELQQNTKAAVAPFQRYLALKPSTEESQSVGYAEQALKAAGVTTPLGSLTGTKTP
jgi:tetratricopeptide (TPR) repeat protein